MLCQCFKWRKLVLEWFRIGVWIPISGDQNVTLLATKQALTCWLGLKVKYPSKSHSSLYCMFSFKIFVLRFSSPSFMESSSQILLFLTFFFCCYWMRPSVLRGVCFLFFLSFLFLYVTVDCFTVKSFTGLIGF